MTTPAKAFGRFSETAIDDEIVVMSLDSGDFFSITGTARDIWELIDGTRDEAEIAGVLAKRYAASREAMSGEISAFLAQLSGAGLSACG